MKLAIAFGIGLVVGVALVVAAGEWWALRRAHRGDSWIREMDAAQIAKRALS